MQPCAGLNLGAKCWFPPKRLTWSPRFGLPSPKWAAGANRPRCGNRPSRGPGADLPGPGHAAERHHHHGAAHGGHAPGRPGGLGGAGLVCSACFLLLAAVGERGAGSGAKGGGKVFLCAFVFFGGEGGVGAGKLFSSFFCWVGGGWRGRFGETAFGGLSQETEGRHEPWLSKRADGSSFAHVERTSQLAFWQKMSPLEPDTRSGRFPSRSSQVKLLA